MYSALFASSVLFKVGDIMKKMAAFFVFLSICALLLFWFNNSPKKDESKETTQSVQAMVEQEQAIVKIGFSTELTNIHKCLTIEELEEWENPYEKYRCSVMYDSLEEYEKVAYRAMEYAMANNYKFIYMDNRTKINSENGYDIVRFLSFDSPLLEQNIIYSSWENSTGYYYKRIAEQDVRIPLEGTVLYISNFTEIVMNKKLEALKEAEKIFATFDTSLSQRELAEVIYRYIAENIEYLSYDNKYGYYAGDLAPFLYDAFINKKTHCDGFTNSMALLFVLAGFEQVEKTSVDHTWNCVKIDGKWYNCDGTASNMIPKKDTTVGAGLYFAFGDCFQEATPDFEDKYPECPESLYMKPDAFLSSHKDSNFFDEAYNGFKAHDKKWTLLIFDEFDYDSAKKDLRKLANRSGKSVFIHTFAVADGKTALLIVKDGFLQR